jgi:hypothetical protein
MVLKDHCANRGASILAVKAIALRCEHQGKRSMEVLGER